MTHPFKLCGVINEADEPYPFLEEAYGVLACIGASIEEDDGERGPLNPLLISAAVRAASTLVHLAAKGLASMDARTEQKAVQHD